MSKERIPIGAICPIIFLFLSLVQASLASEPDYVSPSYKEPAGTVRCAEPNAAVTEYFNLIRRTEETEPELVDALRQFPKGADIHNHLSGSVMPEDYVAMGETDGDCFGPDPATPTMYVIKNAGASGGCNPGFRPLATADKGERLKIVESLSMYQFGYPDIQSGHDQFFATFGRFGAISGMPCDTGPMLAKLLRQADKDNVSYVETMLSLQSQAVNTLAGLLRNRFPDDSYYLDSDNYPAMYDFLQGVGLKDAVTGAQGDISMHVGRANAILRCGLADRDPACAVSFSFIAAVNRNSARNDGSPDLAKIFAQTAFSMLLASNESRVVGVNLVSGEDGDVSMKSFDTQMQFFTYFHERFPKVNIALHAGELTPCFIGKDNPALKGHLIGSLQAGARRIGHGVSFAYLSDKEKAEIAGLMKNAALVEIMFASNAQILGVSGDDHPFEIYRRYGIPTSFSTDDAGVSHDDYTSEWVYGFKRYGLTGEDLKRLARESLQHSFMPGDALWSDLPSQKLASECAGSAPGAPAPPEPCKSFLGRNAKARAQWEYEGRLAGYLRNYGKLYDKYLNGSTKGEAGGSASAKGAPGGSL